MNDTNSDTIPTYTHTEQLALRDDIKKLDSKEMQEILVILQKHKVNVSTNHNGSFFSLKYVPPHVLHQIFKYVQFCMDNKFEATQNQCK